MRLLFVHDHAFHAEAGEVFSPGQLPYATLARYLEIFSSVEVFARTRVAASAPGKLNRSSGPRVSFTFDHGYRSPRDLFVRRAALLQSMRQRIADADAVIARLPSELGQIAVHLSRQMRKPFAVEAVGCAFDAYWNYGALAAKAYAPIMYSRMRRAVAAAPFVLYVTREFLQRRYPSRARTAAISDVQLPPSNREVLTRRLATINAASALRLGFVGSLRSSYKGLDTALLALRALKQAGKQLELRILGGGDQTRWRDCAAKLQVADSVRFDGVLPAGEPVLQWLDAIDLFIQPSKQEGLPRSLIEAMSRGCPAVGSTIGGIPELLPSDCMHRPGDWRGLADRISRIGWDSAQKERLAMRNWEVSATYDAEHLDRQRQAFWREFAEFASR